jgi:hypothetical protein
MIPQKKEQPRVTSGGLKGKQVITIVKIFVHENNVLLFLRVDFLKCMSYLNIIVL